MQSIEWRPVVGYEALYEVSNDGRVRKANGKALQIFPSSNGKYLRVCLSKDGARSSKSVHRLVARAFIGQPTGPEVLHRDDDGHNNALGNLRYGTHSDNMQDRVRHGNHNFGKRTHCPQGHEYTPENTYTYPSGSRSCRKCRHGRYLALKARETRS